MNHEYTEDNKLLRTTTEFYDDQELPEPLPEERDLVCAELLQKYGGITVSYADSLAAGNCESRAKRWCNNNGIDITKNFTLGDVIQGHIAIPMTESWLSIRYVLKKYGFIAEETYQGKKTVEYGYYPSGEVDIITTCHYDIDDVLTDKKELKHYLDGRQPEFI